VLTKIDKLTPAQRAGRIAALAAALDLDNEQLIAFSAVTGDGRNDLAEAIESLLNQPPWQESR